MNKMEKLDMKNDIKVLSGEVISETEFCVRFTIDDFPEMVVLMVFETEGTYWRCVSHSGKVYIGESEWGWMVKYNVQLVDYFINECEITKLPLLFWKQTLHIKISEWNS